MVKTICLLVALSLPARVFAANARELFDSGTNALQAGRPQEALTDFEAAYKERRSPSLLFWIGEAHRALGHKASATRYYRRYLAALPDGPMQADAKARLAELKGTKRSRKNRKMDLQELDLEKAPTASTTAPPPLPLPELPLPDAGPAAPEKSAELQLPLPTTPPAKPVEAPPPVARVTPPPAAAPPAATPAPRPPPTMKVAAAPPAEVRDFYYVQYTARLLAPDGAVMANYATPTSPGAAGSIYTHGLSVGRQTEHFKNGIYFGFGTEDGGQFGAVHDTLLRYELSWQSLWAPLGTMETVSPHIGFRVGGMGVKSERLTGGSFKPGVVIAPQAGLDLQIVPQFILTAGMGYDANFGPDLGPNASVSGFALDLGATARF